jgi:hypothetical protein
MRHREPISPARAGIGMAIFAKEQIAALHFVPFAITID